MTRTLPALWLVALLLKLVVWAAFPQQLALDRLVNLVLLILAAVTIVRMSRQVRSPLLWRVSRKLILSYILVGAVPILLLVTFSLVAFLLIFFDVSSYLVQNRVAAITRQAGTLARSARLEIDREPSSRIQEIAVRRQAENAADLPGLSIAAVRAETLPSWLQGQPFNGLVIRDHVLRAVAIEPAARHAPLAVIVDVPVQRSIGEAELAAAGIHLGEHRPGYSLRTATYFAHRDWLTGTPGRTLVAMNVQVPVLYRFLGQSQGQGTVNVNQLLLIALVAIGILLLVIEMVALSSGLGLARSITAAVDELFSGTERIKAGDFGRPIAVRSDDQLGRLALSFNDMTQRIEALLREQDEKRRMAEELRIAREIQMSLLPQGPLSASGLSIAAMCAPAREVGGDYYDVLPLADGRVGLLIADVSGKGMSAALYMAELKGLMLSLTRIHDSPRALLIEANRIIARHLDSRSFITMTYGIFDAAARTLTCARAGHCPFIRIRAHVDGGTRTDVLAPDGMVVGLNLDGGERFERCLQELTLPLGCGDLVCFFTDGISEAMNAGGDCFGEDRVAGLLERMAADDPETIRDALLTEISGFVHGQPQHDDITMIIVRVE